MLNSLQCVGKLLKKPKEKKEGLIAAAAILVLKAKMVEIETAEKKKKYWPKALIKLIVLEGENNI